MRVWRLALVFLLLALLAASAGAKYFNLPNATFDATLHPDGSVFVVETIAFDFHGDFSFAYRTFPLGDWELADVKVEENGQPLVFEDEMRGNERRITWHYKASDERKTFLLSYSLKDAVKVYDDVAEFNWKVWGDSWEEPLGKLSGSYMLPEAVKSPKDVYSWGHPNLNGKIGMAPDNLQLLFEVLDVPARQWVEVRVVFPRSVLSSTGGAKVMQGRGLEKISGEEQAFGALDAWLPLLLYSLPLLLILVFVALWWRYGRDPLVPFDAEYEREIPADYGPALVKALLDPIGRTAGSNEVLATVLNLALKKYLTLERVKAERFLGLLGREFDYKISFTRQERKGLAPHEHEVRALLKRCAEDKGWTTFQEVEKKIKADATWFDEWFKGFQGNVKAEAKAQGFYSETKATLLFATVALLFLGVGGATAFLSFNPVHVAAGGGSALLVFILGCLLPLLFSDAL